MRIEDIARVPLGTFVRPVEETGTGQTRIEPVHGYLIRHPDATVLLDTGIGAGDDQTEAWYRPRRIPLPQALASFGLGLGDVDLVVNCHLHFDHCGGNPELAGRPIFCQGAELATARAGEYTIDELVDFSGARYELLDGEAEILAGVVVIPTPGHVAGHQSVAVRCADGSVVLAGQSHDSASGFSADVLAETARELGHVAPLPTAPQWLARLLAFDPKRVYFAHDAAVWEPA